MIPTTETTATRRVGYTRAARLRRVVHAFDPQCAAAGPQRQIGLAIAGGVPHPADAPRALDEALDGLDLTGTGLLRGVSFRRLPGGLANRRARPRRAASSSPAPAMTRSSVRELSCVLNVGGRAGRPVRRDCTPDARAAQPYCATRWSDLFLRFGGLAPTDLRTTRKWNASCCFHAARPQNGSPARGTRTSWWRLDGEAVRFGEQGWDDVPISRAVQPAWPGLMSRRWRSAAVISWDGALRRTMHASTVLDRGIDLMIGINPLVPFDANQATPRPTRPNRSAWPAADCRRCRLADAACAVAHADRHGEVPPRHRPAGVRAQRGRQRAVLHQPFSFSSRHRGCSAGLPQHAGRPAKRAATLKPMLAAHGMLQRGHRPGSYWLAWSAEGCAAMTETTAAPGMMFTSWCPVTARRVPFLMRLRLRCRWCETCRCAHSGATPHPLTSNAIPTLKK